MEASFNPILTVYKIMSLVHLQTYSEITLRGNKMQAIKKLLQNTLTMIYLLEYGCRRMIERDSGRSMYVPQMLWQQSTW